MIWIKKFIFILIILLITIFLLEFFSSIVLSTNISFLNAIQKDFIFEKLNKDGEVVATKDSVLPVKKNINLKWSSPEFSVNVHTNDLGLRQNLNIEYKNIDVAFFGDSFTFGHGVESEESYVSIFRKKIKSFDHTKIASFSYINGFQPEHYEFFINNHQDLKPKIAFIGLYLGNDLGADLNETSYDRPKNKLELPYRRINDYGQMVNSKSNYIEPFRFLVDKSSFVLLFMKVIGKTPYRNFLFKNNFQGPNTPNDINLELGKTNLLLNRSIISILNIKSEIERRGGRLKVIIIPQNYFFGYINPHINATLIKDIHGIRAGSNIKNQFIDVCKVKKIECLDLAEILQREDYFIVDAHWRPSGHLKVGNYLVKYIDP